MTMNRKGKEEITYKHLGNTVQAWKGHRSVPPVTMKRKGKGEITYKLGGNTLQAWTGHRSVPPVTGTTIRSYACMILCLYNLVFVLW